MAKTKTPSLAERTAGIAAQRREAKELAYEILMSMHSEERREPTADERLVFEGSGYLELNSSGKPKWQRLLGIVSSVSRHKKNFGTVAAFETAGRKLDNQLARQEQEVPELQEQINALQRKIDAVSEDVARADAIVRRKEDARRSLREIRVLPEYVVDDYRGRIRELKEAAGQTDWWQSQGRLMQLRSIFATPLDELQIAEVRNTGPRGVDVTKAKDYVDSLLPELQKLEEMGIDAKITALKKQCAEIENEARNYWLS
jgi:uncharacterized coiled-coil protein SlyX